MKHVLPSTLLFATVATIAIVAATGATTARAEDNTRLHAVGMDLVRLLDNGQFEPDDGTLNLVYQGYVTRNTGWTLSYAWGDRSSIWEAGFKIYNQTYQSGTFWQVGLASVDVDRTNYNHELAAWGTFGIERLPAPNVVISLAAKAMVGIDHPHTGEKDIIFTPTLTVMAAF
ncbi:MAG: hypothetical protein ACLGHG_00985 [Gammaproteobacteria bacterium]